MSLQTCMHVSVGIIIQNETENICYIAVWQGSCVFTSNNLGFADFIVAN